MDSSGDDSFVWSRASTSSNGADADKLLEDAVKAEKGMKKKKPIKKEKRVKDEELIKTELLNGARSLSPAEEKKRVKKTRVKRESSSSATSHGDTKPVIDKFSADETEVEKRQLQHSTDTSRRDEKRRQRRSTDSQITLSLRRSTDSDSGHNDNTRHRRSRSTDSDSSHNDNTRRRRRSTRHSTSEYQNQQFNKSPKVSPKKLFTSKEYVSASSCDDDNVKQNDTASGSTQTRLRDNGHRDSESSTKSKVRKNKDTTNLNGSTSRKTTISDRIQFEDEDVSASESRQEPTHNLSSRMQRHLKANVQLKQVDVTTATRTAWPGADDELWLLRVPTDLDPNTLKGNTLTLDDKCKVKVDSVTYEGRSEGDGRVTLVMHSDGCIIANVALVNALRFRRKNPRPRVIEDGGNDESEAIPTPPTKRRHPLFGTEYKKAIKLPSAVRKKLKATTSSSMAGDVNVTDTIEVEAVADHDQTVVDALDDKRTKRKRKKERHSDIDGARAGVGVGVEVKRRRKHRDTEWDSEKAIEESLFNF